jgi:hypothetical protein
MAELTPCRPKTKGVNTGYKNSCFFGTWQGFYAVPKGTELTTSDLATFPATIRTKLHAPLGSRWFPVFADLKVLEAAITDGASETFADGTSIQLLPDSYAFTLTFLEGGECLAKAMRQLNGFDLIAVDRDNKYKLKKLPNGNWAPLNPAQILAKPQPKTFSAAYKNVAVINITSDEWIDRATIKEDDGDITAMGLHDVELYQAATASVTKLYVGVQTECDKTNLVTEISTPFATALADVDNFIIKNKLSGAINTPTAVAVNAGGYLEFTGTFAAGQTFTVSSAAASVWLGNNVEGYEGIISVDISIPA